MKTKFLFAALAMLFVSFNFNYTNANNLPAKDSEEIDYINDLGIDGFLNEFEAFNVEFRDAVNRIAAGDETIISKLESIVEKAESLSSQLDDIDDEENVTEAQMKRAESILTDFLQIYQALEKLQLDD